MKKIECKLKNYFYLITLVFIQLWIADITNN